jgi:protein ImuA
MEHVMNINPAKPDNPADIQALRARLCPPAGTRHGVLAFGDARVDACLGGGLALGALHDMAATGAAGQAGAVGAAFLACLLARLPGPGDSRRAVFWIGTATDLHAPGLLAYGLDPGRLVRVRTAGDAATLAAMEAVLRGGAAGAVVAEAGRLERVASRRLQLACLGRGTTGFVLRRWPHANPTRQAETGRQDEAATAAVTRWRLAPAPSAVAFGEPACGEPGPPRWRVELRHARGGMPGGWIMQAGEIDAAHPVHVVAELADPASAPAGWRETG